MTDKGLTIQICLTFEKLQNVKRLCKLIESMIPIRNLLLLMCLSFLIISCDFAQEGKQKNNHTIPELTPKQESALDAFTTLQVNSDERDHLYSTFANISHPCYPPDTSFVISRSELLSAMKLFGEKYYTNLKIEERDTLIATAVLAQTEYEVLHCKGDFVITNYGDGLPMSGTWVMPNVLDRRDVLLVW